MKSRNHLYVPHHENGLTVSNVTVSPENRVTQSQVVSCKQSCGSLTKRTRLNPEYPVGILLTVKTECTLLGTSSSGSALSRRSSLVYHMLVTVTQMRHEISVPNGLVVYYNGESEN